MSIVYLAERVGFARHAPGAPRMLGRTYFMYSAERVGFEPTVTLLPQQFSRLPHSATLAPLHCITVNVF